jgi:peptide-methionine (S)-S-oxide reductase
MNWLWTLLQLAIAGAFLTPSSKTTRYYQRSTHLFAEPKPNANANPPPEACLAGVASEDEDLNKMRHALLARGFESISLLSDGGDTSQAQAFVYRFQKATGMLQLVSSPENKDSGDVPRWIPLISDMETVLIKNGWSFLDPDESEPNSAFDVDAANVEGSYRPKWGQGEDQYDGDSLHFLSSLGFHIAPMASDEITKCASTIGNDQTSATLLEGATDPPHVKRTCNEFDFSGPAGQSDIPRGVFTCAIGYLPLFSTLHLSPTTSSSGWLSFTRPIAEDHVLLVKPEPDADDQRIEVLCAKSRCHLGHFFGKEDGYCINASALNFLRDGSVQSSGKTLLSHPISWRPLDDVSSRTNGQIRDIYSQSVGTENIVFGAGCFWHVEAALRRLPGVVETEVGFAGGTMPDPTYEDVCHQDTGHAEVVLVTFDPTVLSARVLIDSFLALHDPTKVRALGKRAAGTGQYRSSVFVLDANMAQVASEALQDCRSQLQRELSTEVTILGDNPSLWFWKAEERHQRREERRSGVELDTNTISTTEWLREYGRRAQSILGSSETIKLSM